MNVLSKPVAELPGMGWTGRLDERFAARSIADLARRMSRGNLASARLAATERPLREQMQAIIASAVQRESKIVQIGAHDGSYDDPFAAHIEAKDLSGVLVEPQAGPFKKLEARYSEKSRIQCVQAAVGLTAGTMTLWHAELPTQPEFGSGIACDKPEQVRKEVKRCLGSRAARAAMIVPEEVPVWTLGTLLERTATRPDEIALFATDIEGDDVALVQNLVKDYGIYPPVLQWEHFHADPAEAVSLNRHMEQEGYALLTTHKDTLAYK